MNDDRTMEPVDVYQPVVTQPLIEPKVSPLLPSEADLVYPAEQWQEDTILNRALSEIQAQKQQQAQATAHERVLAQVIERIYQTLDLQTIFSTATSEVRHLLYADRVAILKFDPDAEHQAGEFVAEAVGPEFDSVLGLSLTDLDQFEQHHCRGDQVGQIVRMTDTQRMTLREPHRQFLARFKVQANLVVPLLSRQKLWGLLCVHQCCGPRQWQSAEVEFVSRIALQLGVALQQAALLEQTRQDSVQIQAQAQKLERIAKQERTLNEVVECIRQTLDMQHIFTTATSLVRQLLQADRVAIYRFDRHSVFFEGEFVAEDSAPEFPFGLMAKLHGRAFGSQYVQSYQNGQPFKISDTSHAALGEEHLQMLSRLKVRAEVIIPLLQGQQLWGLLCIHQCSAPRDWKDSEVDFATRIASNLGVALQQAELFEQTQLRSVELQKALAEVQEQKAHIAQVAAQERTSAYLMRRIRQSLDLQQIFKVATQDVRDVLQCDRVVIYQFQAEGGGAFMFEAARSGIQPWIQSAQPTLWNDTYLQQQHCLNYQNLEPTLVADIYAKHYAPCYLEQLEALQIRASVLVPVFLGDRLWGLLGAYESLEPRDWKKGEVQLLERVADQLGVALQQSELLEQLKQAKEQADTANQSKTVFLANMSHELRTPLNAILGFSQLMTRDRNMTPQQRDTLDIINRSGAHLLTLINDVLEMSKIEAGQSTLNPAPFDLGELLHSLHEMFALKAQSKSLTLQFDYPTDAPLFLYADAGKLRQVLINLLGNAIKFTQSGTVTLRVHPLLHSPSLEGTSPNWASPTQAPVASTLQFTITDTGPGIPQTDLNRVFEAFVQTDTGHRFSEGTGLGLTISQYFVRLMGGDIQIQSQVGQGTTVQFSIQATAVTSIPPSTQGIQRVIGLAPNQPRYRILVVEDQLENRQFMVRLLTAVGFEVRAAENGETAIAYWRTWYPHLIWMDWRIPVLDGATTTQRIRELEALRNQLEQSRVADAEDFANLSIPPSPAFFPFTRTFIIAVTANVFKDLRSDITQAGCDDFIQKPFHEADLFEKITQYLGVQYLYECAVETSPGATPAINRTELLHQMAQLPTPWLMSLENAAITLDEGVVLQRLEELDPPYHLIATELTGWAKDLELHKIAEVAERALARQCSQASASPESAGLGIQEVRS